MIGDTETFFVFPVSPSASPNVTLQKTYLLYLT